MAHEAHRALSLSVALRAQLCWLGAGAVSKTSSLRPGSAAPHVTSTLPRPSTVTSLDSHQSISMIESLGTVPVSV